MQYFNTILKQKAIIFRRVKFVFRHGSTRKSCGSSSKGAQYLQCVIRLINVIRTFTQSRTQSLQAFWAAGQRREDSGDIEKIQFF